MHSSADGDTIFFLSGGEVEVNADALGDLSAYVMAEAIKDGVMSAASAYGFKAVSAL